MVKNKDEKAINAIDDNPKTYFEIALSKKAKAELVIDLNENRTIKGFAYTPIQGRYKPLRGIISHYSFYISSNGKNWTLVSKGEFSNIINNPLRSTINLSEARTTRFVKFVGEKVADNNKAIIAELDVITK